MIDKKKILQQIQSDEDKILVSRLFDLAKSARGGWRPSGFFLDRGKCLKIPLWFGDCEPVLWGGYPDAERCMVSFGEKEAEGSWFPLSAVKLISPIPWEISHRDVLGALMNLGIDRAKTGDIIVDEQSAVLFCEEALTDFLLQEIRTVGRYSVKTEEISIDSIVIPEKKFREVTDTVASLRADCVVAAIYSLPRGKAQEAIASGRVSVNWEELTSTSTELNQGDVISLRGMGRSELTEIGGLSRKGRTYIKAKRFL